MILNDQSSWRISFNGMNLTRTSAKDIRFAIPDASLGM